MGEMELLRLACTNEAEFVEIVKADSAKIPPSVRMFLADHIRNALMGMKVKDDRARIIEKALATVGI